MFVTIQSGEVPFISFSWCLQFPSFFFFLLPNYVYNLEKASQDEVAASRGGTG